MGGRKSGRQSLLCCSSHFHTGSALKPRPPESFQCRFVACSLFLSVITKLCNHWLRFDTSSLIFTRLFLFFSRHLWCQSPPNFFKQVIFLFSPNSCVSAAGPRCSVELSAMMPALNADRLQLFIHDYLIFLRVCTYNLG